jgi:type II secretion system protein C
VTFASAVFLLAVAAPPADLSATGIVIGSGHQSSTAVVRSAGQSRVVTVGDAAFGGRVTAIAWTGVSIDFDGNAVEVRVRPPSPRSAPVVPPSAAPAARADASSTSKTMSREEVQRRVLDESPKILAETAVTPVTENGRVSGLALTRIPGGANLLTDAGLQAGDVLTEINGTAIDGLPTLINLYSKLQGEREIRAVVQRNGQPVTLSVRLR